MRNQLREYWREKGPRITLSSLFIALALSVVILFLFRDGEFGAGLFGLVFASVMSINCFGDMVSGKTASRDGNNENISLSKNPIQYCFDVGLQLIIIAFVTWISLAGITRSFTAA